MPDGLTHFRYYKYGLLAEIPISISLCFLDAQFGVGNFVGYFCGRWIDPDIDLMGVNAAEGRQVNELPIIGHILFGLSSIYGSMFRKYHRHWITHFPGISTFIRLFIIFILPILALRGYGVRFTENGWNNFWIGVWVGLSQADGIHWFLDKTYGDK